MPGLTTSITLSIICLALGSKSYQIKTTKAQPSPSRGIKRRLSSGWPPSEIATIKTLKLQLIIWIVFLSIAACSNDRIYVTKHQWKYDHGFWIGDRLSFDNKSYSIRNDTVFKNDTAVALFIQLDKLSLGENQLVIKSIKTNDIGIYIEK